MRIVILFSKCYLEMKYLTRKKLEGTFIVYISINLEQKSTYFVASEIPEF